MMKIRIFDWLGREWVEINDAARPGASVQEEIVEICGSVEAELKGFGL